MVYYAVLHFTTFTVLHILDESCHGDMAQWNPPPPDASSPLTPSHPPHSHSPSHSEYDDTVGECWMVMRSIRPAPLIAGDQADPFLVLDIIINGNEVDQADPFLVLDILMVMRSIRPAPLIAGDQADVPFLVLDILCEIRLSPGNQTGPFDCKIHFLYYASPRPQAR